MANKKVITSAVAVTAAAAMLLGGTLAWQSTNQTALNEASDVINPGGRLHDDFNGENKDVYVENFADEEIFARIRLDEYFEVVINKGTPAEAKDVVTKDAEGNDADKADQSTWPTYNFGDENRDENGNWLAGGDYWNWYVGGETVYMPTYNLNKDSLKADVNGTYAGPDGTDGQVEGDDADRYADYYEYFDGETTTGDEVYDIDTNNVEEENPVEDDNIKTVAGVEHIAKSTGYADLISMSEWLDMVESDGGYDVYSHGNYWVYDNDGWVYWSAPIQPDSATGLLLDGIELNQVMDDSWYYAINVIGQFVTADDMGSAETGDGFYDTEKGSAPSAEALDLLEKIGVDVSGAGEQEPFVPQGGTITNDLGISLVANDPTYLNIDEDTDTITVYDNSEWETVDVVLDHDTLTFNDTTNTVYRWNDDIGEYEEEDPEYGNITAPSYLDNQIEIYLSADTTGQWMITSTYDDGAGNTFEGSVEFNVGVYIDLGGGEDDETPTSAIDLWCDDYDDMVSGDEFIIFEAIVYDEYGTDIAYTNDVTFEVKEITASGASTFALFNATEMDDNALFVAGDIIERGVTEILVNASYTDDLGNTYYGSYSLYVDRNEESPLSIGLMIDGKEIQPLPYSDNAYQLFPPVPAANTYEFNAKLNDAATSAEWSIEEDESEAPEWAVEEREDGYCYMVATENWSDNWEGIIPGMAIAKINKSTGAFNVLVEEEFPYSMYFGIVATAADADGVEYTNTATLFLRRNEVFLRIYNVDAGGVNDFESSQATYTKGTEDTVNIGVSLEIKGVETTVSSSELSWKLYTGDRVNSENAVSESSYSVEENNGNYVLTLKNLNEDYLTLEAVYDYDKPLPENAEGKIRSNNSINITADDVVVEDDGEVKTVVITDEYGGEEATYIPNTYQKVKLDAVPYTQNGDEVYSGTFTWALEGDYENVKLVQNDFTAEVWFLKANEESVNVKALYHKPGDSSIQAEGTFTITKEAGYEPELSFYIDANPSGYTPGLSTNNITLAPYADFDGEDVLGSVEITDWSISGNTSEETKLTDNDNGTKNLYISAYETGVITVTVSYTYEGEENTYTVDIYNHPPVGSMTVYNDETGEHLGVTYKPGTAKEINLTTYFFPTYTGGVQSKDDAYTGNNQEVIASHASWYLSEVACYDEISVTGVTLDQNEEKVVVKIDEDASESFDVVCCLDSGMQVAYTITAKN